MGKIIAMFNQKGGVGKTTTCANLCAYLAMEGKKVLVVDFDPQGNLSSGLGIDKKAVKYSTYDLIINHTPWQDVCVHTSVQRLDILPGSIELAGAEVELSSLNGRERVLKEAIKTTRDVYDFVFIDCPPSLGLLPINALAAGDSVLIPIQCEYYALEGVSQLVNTVNLIRRSLNAGLSICGVVLTMFDNRTNLSMQVVDEVKNFFGDAVFQSIIPRNVRLAEAPSFGQTILEYDKNSKGAQAYGALAKEVIAREEAKR